MNRSESRRTWLASARLGVLGLLVALVLLPGPVVADELSEVLWDPDPTTPMPVFIPEAAFLEFQRTYPALWDNFLVPQAASPHHRLTPGTTIAPVRCGDTSHRVATGPATSNSKLLSEVIEGQEFLGTGFVRKVSAGWGGGFPATIAYVELASASFVPSRPSHTCAADACGAARGELLPILFALGRVTVPGVGEVCVDEPRPELRMPRVDEEILFTGYLLRAGSRPHRYLAVNYWWVRPADGEAFEPQPFTAIRDRGPVSPAFVNEALRVRAQQVEAK